MSSETELNVKIQESKFYSLDHIRYWNHFVDIISVIWVVAFMISLLASDMGLLIINNNIIFLLDTITLFLLPVFIFDLMIKYYLTGHSRTFLKKHWISILLVIPYFRVLKMLSFIKFIKIVQLSKIPKVTNSLLKILKLIHKTLNLKKR